MKTFKTVPVNKCHQIQCDKCGRSAKLESGDFEFHEFTSITRTCGYGSGQDDGSTYETDLCQYCAKELLGNYWRTKEAEEKPTWDSFIDDTNTPQSELDDLAIEIEKGRDSQLSVGSEPKPGQVCVSRLGRYFLELSNESVEFLELEAESMLDISVGDALVTLWKE